MSAACFLFPDDVLARVVLLVSFRLLSEASVKTDSTFATPGWCANFIAQNNTVLTTKQIGNHRVHVQELHRNENLNVLTTGRLWPPPPNIKVTHPSCSALRGRRCSRARPSDGGQRRVVTVRRLVRFPRLVEQRREPAVRHELQHLENHRGDVSKQDNNERVLHQQVFASHVGRCGVEVTRMLHVCSPIASLWNFNRTQTAHTDYTTIREVGLTSSS